MRRLPEYRTTYAQPRKFLVHKRTHTSQLVIAVRMLRDLCIMLWRAIVRRLKCVAY
jgi:hypothetical protein